jgi:ubiquinone/menaquinone biosynthesis C-methylase UbiE
MPETMSQTELWNGEAGRAWVEAQPLVDRVLAPFERVLVDEARAAGARNVLDVGCGTGATTLALAATAGACTGVDISAPMLEAARARAREASSPATFVHADAATHPFEPGTFDLVASRFGVMFFEDPVAAFANLRRATTPGGALRVIVWRSREENEFMTLAERAAAPVLGDRMPAPDGDEEEKTGQFAFAGERRVRSILDAAGWRDAELRPLDLECTLPAAWLVPDVTRFGALGRLLADADEATRARVTEAVLPQFDRYVHGDEVRFPTACTLVVATA